MGTWQLQAQLPVAAPSANRFGHVSPTLASHVLHDLGDQPITVVDGEAAVGCSGGPVSSGATCQVGIESTVVKLSPSGRGLLVYRRGGVGIEELRSALSRHGLSDVEITFSEGAQKAFTAISQGAQSSGVSSASRGAPSVGASASLAADSQHHRDDDGATEAPGQLLRHYAPDLDTFLLPPANQLTAPASAVTDTSGSQDEFRAYLHDAVLIDYGATYANLKPFVAAYTDLSPSGSVEEARRRVFGTLRWTETTAPNASRVLLALPPRSLGQGDPPHTSSDDPTDALTDRLFRAASGRFLPSAIAKEMAGVLTTTR